MHPDLATMKEDLLEAQSFKDPPYTCMLNPFLPCVGISVSAIVVGYMDILVWATFFVVVALTAASYFLWVIPSKHKDKVNKDK